ncbi:mandelate racemase/muconate lactonizing enzyme family protein [Candidatus Latescibacterota bacterium]
MLTEQFDRRNFMKTAAVGSAAAVGMTGMIPSETLSAISGIESMKITKIEAVQVRKYNWTWVRIYTDNGIIGIGETYPLLNSQTGALKDLSGMLIGRNPRDIERIWRDMFTRAAFYVTGGAEMRIISAVNIALWDILGKALGLPVYSLLGGKAQNQLRVYDTYHGINNMNLHKDIEKITRYLLDRGITAIKLFHYNQLKNRNNGSYISPADLEGHLDLIKRIRKEAGDEMEIGMEFNGGWNLTCALRIAESLEPYKIMFIEDIMFPDNMQSYSVLARETSIPICISERLATRYQYREMLESKSCDIVMWDVTWCGGITEAKKISDMADTYYIPTIPHTNGGPVLWLTSIHTATALTNFFIMESCHPNYTTKYPEFVKDFPVPENGAVTAPDKPGLGIEFRTEPFENGDAVVEIIVEI